MTRPKSAHTTTQVNFRMPEILLKEIDALADKNYHDRSSEINNACRYWIASGAGETWASQTTNPYGTPDSSETAISIFAKEDTERPLNRNKTAPAQISDLKTAIETLTAELAAESKNHTQTITALKNEIASLTASFETERKLLLNIIEGHETTIRNILCFADKKTDSARPAPLTKNPMEKQK